jgi:hypothetical protein
MLHQSELSHESICWVFIRHSECIRVKARQLSLIIEGPQQASDQYRFDSEQDLQSFQMMLAEQLSERGWLLCASSSSSS